MRRIFGIFFTLVFMAVLSFTILIVFCRINMNTELVSNYIISNYIDDPLSDYESKFDSFVNNNKLDIVCMEEIKDSYEWNNVINIYKKALIDYLNEETLMVKVSTGNLNNEINVIKDIYKTKTNKDITSSNEKLLEDMENIFDGIIKNANNVKDSKVYSLAYKFSNDNTLLIVSLIGILVLMIINGIILKSCARMFKYFSISSLLLGIGIIVTYFIYHSYSMIGLDDIMKIVNKNLLIIGFVVIVVSVINLIVSIKLLYESKLDKEINESL